jgi:UDP-glucose 4-epimerase
MVDKIVITGALGHIGSHLIRALPLSYPEAEFVLLDNMTTQRFPSLFDLPDNRYSFFDVDVCTADLAPHFKDAGAVVHLAALTDAAGSFERKGLVERTNFDATKRVAESCIEAGASFVYPSSTSVYGTQNELVDEMCSEQELQPQSPYAETKLKEEEYLADMGTKGLKFVTCRFGTIFGVSPGMRFHTAVNKFCWQASLGQPLTVWSTAYQQKRPYLSLLDAGAAIDFIIRENKFDNQVYNVLTMNATVEDIVNTIRAFVPDLEVGFVDSKIMNQLSYEVSTERFRKLGFEYAGDLKASIGETIALLQNTKSRTVT